MGEYKEIEGQIARIESVFRALHGLRASATNGFVSVGTALIDENRRGFFASIGGASTDQITEHRPTIAGALLALEVVLAARIDDQVDDLKRLEGLLAELKLPEIVIGGSK